MIETLLSLSVMDLLWLVAIFALVVLSGAVTVSLAILILGFSVTSTYAGVLHERRNHYLEVEHGNAVAVTSQRVPRAVPSVDSRE